MIINMNNGADVSAVTALASDVKDNKQIVDADGNVIQGTLNRTIKNDITVTNNEVFIPNGYIMSEKNPGYTITVGSAKDTAKYTVKSSNQTIASGKYLTGDQTIYGISKTSSTCNTTSDKRTFHIPNMGTAEVFYATTSTDVKVLFLSAYLSDYSTSVFVDFVHNYSSIFWFNSGGTKIVSGAYASEYASNYTASDQYATGAIYLPNMYTSSGKYTYTLITSNG